MRTGCRDFKAQSAAFPHRTKKMLLLQPFWSLRCLSQMQTNKENLANWLDVWAKLLYGLVSWWRCRSQKQRIHSVCWTKTTESRQNSGQLQGTEKARFHVYFKVRVKLFGSQNSEFASQCIRNVTPVI